MENKVYVTVIIPSIAHSFTVFLPINKRIGNIILLINKAVREMINNSECLNDDCCLYNQQTKEKYDFNMMLHQTNIRNGSKLVLL